MDDRPAAERRQGVVLLFHEASGCVECPLSEGRTNVVVGARNADADLIFVGEAHGIVVSGPETAARHMVVGGGAPGYEGHPQGLPLVGPGAAVMAALRGVVGQARK